MNTLRLQTALDSTPFPGKITKVFSSKFGHVYDVGIAHLDSGEDVVIKIKDNPRSRKYSTTYSREVEYKNLRALERIDSSLIPKAIYYKDGVLLMTLIQGEPLRMVNQDDLNTDAFVTMGATLRKINDLKSNELSHLIRFDSFRKFLEHEFELFFNERVNPELLPLSFYEDFREKMFGIVNDEHPADIVLVAKDAYGAENVLVKDKNISGLIDFEDLMFAPRLLQLRPPVDKKYMSEYNKGYGQEIFKKNYYQPHLDILKAISTLRALYVADEEDSEDFKQVCIKTFNELMQNLECSLHIVF